jgi:hypothetical protein
MPGGTPECTQNYRHPGPHSYYLPRCADEPYGTGYTMPLKLY